MLEGELDPKSREGQDYGSRKSNQVRVPKNSDYEQIVDKYISNEVTNHDCEEELPFNIMSTMNAIPARPEIIKNCPFPFGFIMEPFRETSRGIKKSLSLPSRCSKCGAVITAHIQRSVKGDLFTCAICGQLNERPTPIRYEQETLSVPAPNSMDLQRDDTLFANAHRIHSPALLST